MCLPTGRKRVIMRLNTRNQQNWFAKICSTRLFLFVRNQWSHCTLLRTGKWHPIGMLLPTRYSGSDLQKNRFNIRSGFAETIGKCYPDIDSIATRNHCTWMPFSFIASMVPESPRPGTDFFVIKTVSRKMAPGRPGASNFYCWIKMKWNLPSSTISYSAVLRLLVEILHRAGCNVPSGYMGTQRYRGTNRKCVRVVPCRVQRRLPQISSERVLNYRDPVGTSGRSLYSDAQRRTPA